MPIEDHLDRMSPEQRKLWEQLDTSILALGAGMTRRSRVRGFKYYGKRKLCDVSVHGDHLSVYIQGLNIKEYPADSANAVVGGGPHYIHAHLKTSDDHDEIVGLLEKGLAALGG